MERSLLAELLKRVVLRRSTRNLMCKPDEKAKMFLEGDAVYGLSLIEARNRDNEYAVNEAEQADKIDKDGERWMLGRGRG